MEPEEPIVAAYRNTYDVAWKGALRHDQVLVQPPGGCGKPLHLVIFATVAIGTIVGVLLAYGYDLFGEFVTLKNKVVLVVSLLALVFLSTQTTKRGQRRFWKAFTRLWFRWSRGSNRVVIFTIDDDAIVTHVEGEDRRYHQVWRGLGKVVRTQDGFVLLIPKHWSMAWVPLEAFKSEQDIERFAQLARDNVREYVVLPE